MVSGFAEGVDGILQRLFRDVLQDDAERVSMVAVGGYGRQELCPHSDVDLLFVIPPDLKSERLERFVRILWDARFDLGHSVRTANECYQYMADDHVTAAALLESRFLDGSEDLYRLFQSQAVDRYRKKKSELFVQTKLEQLRASLFGPGRTTWVLEPHFKDGCATLRDVQRVRWVESIRRGNDSFEEIARGEAFAPEDIEMLREAYDFFLRVRCELHFTNQVKQDILERDCVHDIAESLGYEGSPRDAVDGLMSDYYSRARDVSRFLRFYLETGTRGRSFFGKLSHKFFRSPEKPYLLRDKGLLFPYDEFPTEDLEREILEVFRLVQTQDLVVSEALSRKIRLLVGEADVDFARSREATEIFAEILRGPKVGRVLKAMQRTGVLPLVLPEFAAIDGFITFSGYHQYTVDEHTLRTIEELDRVLEGDELVPPEFVALWGEIDDSQLYPLRLALLLHDVGKGMSDRDHSVLGAEVAILVCERFGIGEEASETVEFLIYRHLTMFRRSERRDLSDDGVIREFADIVRDVDRLRLLYLFTYLDVTSVGPGTWTSWKGAQLAELYDRTLEFLQERSGEGPPRPRTVDELIATTDLEDGDKKRVIELCRHIESPVYFRETVPERMLLHAGLVEQCVAQKSLQVGHDSFAGFHEIAVCTQDRERLFADVAGVLFSEGLDLLGARIYSRDDDLALDLFYVEVVDGVSIALSDRVERVRKKLQQIDANQLSVEEILSRWERSYFMRKRRPQGTDLHRTRVKFDNDVAGSATAIDVMARDRPGLLFDLASAINRLGLDIRHAKVSTLADRAHDIFYAVELDGQKILNPARRKEVELALLAEIERPSRALADELWKGE